MPRKTSQPNDESEKEEEVEKPNHEQSGNEIENLTRMLAAVLDYLSDEENEVIDVEYIIDNTEGLRDWWKQYKENNRKRIEEEIAASLGDLSFEQLKKIREQIKENG
ncbi:hypothetical protein [Ureibacillus acetophenoni]|uniref:Uncharacterized protein n=1 Tax=Ureibacillus acetophenoni TaxID=614649 RepID=A0A285UQK1_9BACL|nr:hypothetical protein [Ureibacillus acetophenoni]SOC44099.1 hypothetical protein SAMN05877842_11912 [Ureibacillus acetophenoni]